MNDPKPITLIKRDYLQIEFTSIEEIGEAIIQSPGFLLGSVILLKVSKENSIKIMDLLIQQIEEMPSSSFVGEIVMDKFFLPQYPKQIINVSPTWFDKSFDENKSILEIR